MKSKLTLLILFILIIGSSFTSVNSWDNIKEKTWISESGGCINGEQIVFYESKNGVKKAVKQLYGSGVYVIATFIYDVDVYQDTFYLKDCSDKIDLKLIYKNRDLILASSNDSLKYKILSNEPIIYNWQGNFHGGEKLPINTLKNVFIQKGMIYDKNSFKDTKIQE